jgi:cytosine/adenosine deaminase-related metal-dependent hydrolase
MPARADRSVGTGALQAVTVHTAPLLLPVSGPPIEDGALAVRAGRVLRIGPRERVEALYPAVDPVRWPGMIVPGLVDAHVRLGRGLPSALAHGVTAIAGVVPDPDAAPRPAARPGPAPHPGPEGDPGVVPDTGRGTGSGAGHDACPDLASAAAEAGLGGVTYLETRCASEDLWEAGGRDRLITAIREVDHPGIVGIAAHSPDPLVMEDLAVLSRTFGLRLLVELGHRTVAFLDETGVLGAGSHVVLSGPPDEADRKLLRVRGTAAALASPFAAQEMLDGRSAVAIGTRTGGDPLALARVFARDPGTDRLLVEALTLGGARALGLDEGPGRLGRLEPGCRADFAVFDVEADTETACTALLHEGPGRCVAAFTGGRPAWRRRAAGEAGGLPVPADGAATG